MQQRECLCLAIEYFFSFKSLEVHDDFCGATDILLAFLLTLMSLIYSISKSQN